MKDCGKCIYSEDKHHEHGQVFWRCGIGRRIKDRDCEVYIMRPELVFAALTAHPQKYEQVISAIQSRAVSPIELAGALGGKNSSGQYLPRAAYLYGLRKWAGDQTVMAELCNLAYQYTVDLCIEQRWQKEKWWSSQVKPGAERIRLLSKLALADSLGFGLCEACDGRQWDYSINPPIRCETCCGTGNASPSGRALSEQFGVDRSNWSRRWANKYNQIIRLYHGWDIVVLSHIADRLG